MAKLRTIQILRGTTAQNAAYTGSAGELTMDTTTNELRLHNGSTAGGYKIGGTDYVVDFQQPTSSNNYTWYRKYKSGWVEQGGTFGSAFATYTEKTITLPVSMADTNYCGFVTTYGNATNYTSQLAEKTTTTVKFGYVINLIDNGATWAVQGMSASA